MSKNVFDDVFAGKPKVKFGKVRVDFGGKQKVTFAPKKKKKKK